MRANTRSTSGALLMLVIIPLFAGLLACMPEHVPLGDPERARIRPEMSGVWYTGDADDLLGQVVVLQPWDKRTWLLLNILMEQPDDDELYDFATYDGLVRWLADGRAQDEEVPLAAILYKAWLTKIGGETFMTWEIRGLPNEDRDGEEGLLDPWWWWDFRVTASNGSAMVLHLLDDEFPPLKEAPRTRRGWEKVIRKHAQDDALYLENAMQLRRVDPEHEGLFGKLVSEAMVGEL